MQEVKKVEGSDYNFLFSVFGGGRSGDRKCTIEPTLNLPSFAIGPGFRTGMERFSEELASGVSSFSSSRYWDIPFYCLGIYLLHASMTMGWIHRWINLVIYRMYFEYELEISYLFVYGTWSYSFRRGIFVLETYPFQ